MSNNQLTPENKYFYALYSRAYQRMQYWQDQMHKREGGSPAWQIASTYRAHYADLCLWLDSNSPSNIGFKFHAKKG
jgi:hypothetical protein